MGRFLGVATAFRERQGRLGVWKTPRGVHNALFSRDYGPDFPRQWATTAPVLPRKTLVLATMLWSGVGGVAVFLRSLARDLRAGGRVVSTQRPALSPPDRSGPGSKGRRRKPEGTKLARLWRVQGPRSGRKCECRRPEPQRGPFGRAPLKEQGPQGGPTANKDPSTRCASLRTRAGKRKTESSMASPELLFYVLPRNSRSPEIPRLLPEPRLSWC